MNIDYYGHTVACHEHWWRIPEGRTPNLAKYL